jgi:LPS sulfotransferase NodH
MATTEQRLLNRFKQLNERADSKNVDKSILIISTPRCGSTLYCDVLSDLNMIGQCKEWFNMRYISAYATFKGISNINFQEYLHFLKLKTTNNTGVFSVNVHVEQYIDLLKHNLDITELGFDCVVYLSRKNKIAQAVSLTKAQITDKWSADATAKCALPERPPLAKIAQSLSHIINSHDYYVNKLQAICDFEYCYEDFKDLSNHLPFIQPLSKLELKVKQKIELKTQRIIQSDCNSSDWLNEFNQLLGR